MPQLDVSDFVDSPMRGLTLSEEFMGDGVGEDGGNKRKGEREGTGIGMQMKRNYL